jgi:hypothetical protein
MRYWIIAAVLSMVFVGGCAQKSMLMEGKDSATISWSERLNVQTSPSGCDIYVDGENMGLSPAVVSKVTPFRFNIVRGSSWKSNHKYDSFGRLQNSWTSDYKISDFYFTGVVVPHTVELRFEKEGYKPIRVLLPLSGSDTKVQEFLKAANLASSAEVREGKFPEVPPREVKVNLDALPGYFTLSEWKDSGVVEEKGVVSVNFMDLEIVPDGAHSAKVSGSVEARRKISVEQVRTKHYPASGKTEKEVQYVERVKTYVPSAVSLENPFGNDCVFRVNAQGKFGGKLTISDKYLFKDIADLKYRKVVECPVAFVCAWDASEGRGIESRFQFPTVWKYAADFEQALKYADGRTCLIRVEMMDKATRHQVTPEVLVRSVAGPSQKIFESELSSEFGSDEIGAELVKETMCSLRKKGLLLLGEAVQDKTQLVRVLLCVSSKCSVSTVHPEYYYFEGSFEITETGSLEKAILLVETGEKVRQEQVKEGDSGIIVELN